MLVDDFGYDGKVLNTNDRPLVKKTLLGLTCKQGRSQEYILGGAGLQQRYTKYNF